MLGPRRSPAYPMFQTVRVCLHPNNSTTLQRNGGNARAHKVLMRTIIRGICLYDFI
jgi:hypothetical protein